MHLMFLTNFVFKALSFKRKIKLDIFLEQFRLDNTIGLQLDWLVFSLHCFQIGFSSNVQVNSGYSGHAGDMNFGGRYIRCPV